MKKLTLVNAVAPQKAGQEDKLPPLGPLSIAAVLEQKGWQVDFRDLQLETPLVFKPDKFVNFLSDAADIIGISCLSNDLPTVCAAISQLKQNHPHKMVILGGIGPSLVAEDLLRCFPLVDVVVKGEGETATMDLVDAIASRGNLTKVKGIAYRDTNNVVVTAHRPRICDLEQLPLPAYHLFDFSKIDHDSLSEAMVRPASVITSRGCAYKCTFCANAAMWPEGVRFRSIESVIKEVLLLKEVYNRNFIHFCDDVFTLDRTRVTEICRRLENEVGHIKWSCSARIDTMNKELLKIMARAGCVEIQYGVESGSDGIRHQLGKQFSSKDALGVIADSTMTFPSVRVSFMWGFPFECLEDLYDTMLFMKILSEKGVRLNFTFLEPQPGTVLFKQYADKLRTLDTLSSTNRPRLYDYSEQFVEFIKAYPSLFTNLYYIDSQNLYDKVKSLQRFGLHNLNLSDFRLSAGIERRQPVVSRVVYMKRAPKVAPNIRLRELAGTFYIFNVSDSACHEINEESAQIMQGCLTGKSPSHIATMLAEHYGVSPTTATSYVQDILWLFLTKGWVKFPG